MKPRALVCPRCGKPVVIDLTGDGYGTDEEVQAKILEHESLHDLVDEIAQP